MKPRYFLFGILLLLSACSTSPWDGASTNSPAYKIAEKGCVCMESYLQEKGVDTGALLKVAEEFKADRKLVTKSEMTEEAMRAKYPEEFAIAESLPGLMTEFGEYPCNKEVSNQVMADSLSREFSDALQDHCLLTTYFQK